MSTEFCLSSEHKRERTDYNFHKSAAVQQLLLDSFSDLVEFLKNQYEKNSIAGILSICLPVIGIIVFAVGGFWYLIVTFRVGVLWGLSCLFLPFVSLIFLFAHWKVASKPFFVSILGMAVTFSGIFLADVNGQGRLITNSPATSSFLKKETSDEKYSCNGKIYCSEMTSCAEAKFYQHNCPGTKMDGDRDGIPCESQWCGR